MVGKCSNLDCIAPSSCHEAEEDYLKCSFWIKNNPETNKKNIPKRKNTEKPHLSWTGEAYNKNDIPQISFRTTPIHIGIIGAENAGKTTFLAMLYTLLLRGEGFDKFDFTGTKTILGWDKLYHKLKVQKNKVAFPSPTPTAYLRFLHIALRDSNNTLKDILFSDASGEVFSIWSKYRADTNAENARWIYEHSNGFILFIDCEDLIKNKNSAKTKILDIAQMLKYDLCNRPVISVWSKADKKEEIHQKIKDSLRKELKGMFINYKELDISNFSKEDPDKLVHENNLKVIDWLLSEILKPSGEKLVIENNYKTDLFLNYKIQ